MGNSTTTEFLKDYEYQKGEKLIRSIKANSREQIMDSIDIARKELLNNRQIAHDKEYDEMIQKMTQYLTRKYDMGEGGLFGGKTPLELAKELRANHAIDCLNEQILLLSRNQSSSKVLQEKDIKALSSNSVIGPVDKTRAIEARERLKAFQETRNKK